MVTKIELSTGNYWNDYRWGFEPKIILGQPERPIYLVCTNIHLSALNIVKYYAKRWRIEQTIKDFKQRLGFGDYQARYLHAIQQHVALALLSYFVLILLKVLQLLRNKHSSCNLSIRFLALWLSDNTFIITINNI